MASFGGCFRRKAVNDRFCPKVDIPAAPSLRLWRRFREPNSYTSG